MSEEQSGTPTEAAPQEYASIGDNGEMILSPEALDAMDNVQPPADEEATPIAEAEAEVDATPAPTARKIKHNGQEVEVSPDDEVALIQKGYDYDYKMAALETERARLQQYNGLVSAIEASPDVRQKVSAALGYAQDASAKTSANETPVFDDPIEQLKWETRQEVMREVEEKFIRPMQQQSQQQTHAQTLNNVRQQVQADPQFKEIQAEIVRTIKALPESVGKNLYSQLDQDPRSYMDMFNTTKERLRILPVPDKPQAKEAIPAPTKRETKAPLLESGNNDAPSASEQQKQTERIKELTKKSKAGDFRATGELMALMA